MRIGIIVALAVGALAAPAAADEIVLPPPPFTPTGTITAHYHLDRPLTGRGSLRLEWLDVAHRVVERRTIAVALADAADIAFTLDLRRAVMRGNLVKGRLSLDGGAEREAQTPFIVVPRTPPWSDYQIIMWQSLKAPQYEALKAIGVSAGMLHFDRSHPEGIGMEEAAPLIASGLPWYVENIATDFYSAYHRWFPSHPPNWRFTEAQALYRANPLDPIARERDPSLSDPQWLDRVRDRLSAAVQGQRRFGPLYYNLGDEPGIADLAAFWDFDFSAPSLDAMRRWLAERYDSLAALNAEWGTDFAAWDQVMPQTTREAMQRGDENFAAWADFKAWMDVAFARAVAAGRDAVHAADPTAIAALEGLQVPGWGGYDYARLAHAVDAMEIYDGGGNVDLVHGFNPEMVLLTTSFDGGAGEAHRVWRELLRGTRGLVLWDEKFEFVNDDGTLGPRGRAAAPYFREISGGIGALVINARALSDPVCLLYSPESMRTQWMLDWKPRGDAWLARDSEAEGGSDNTVRQAMLGYIDGVAQLGLTSRFLASESLAPGTLAQCRVVILPHVIALAAAAAGALRGFAASGGTLVADVAPGSFDEHSRRLDHARLADLFGAEGKGKAVFAAPGGLRDLLATAGVASGIVATRTDGTPAPEIEIHRFANGAVELVGLQLQGVPPTGQGETIALRLPRAAFVYDVRARKPLGRGSEWTLALDPIAPTLLAISDTELPLPTVAGPERLRLGEIGEFRLGLAGPAVAAHDMLRIEVIDPGGAVVPAYSGTVMAAGGTTTRLLPLAVSDAPGAWRMRVTNLMTGAGIVSSFEVMP